MVEKFWKDFGMAEHSQFEFKLRCGF